LKVVYRCWDDFHYYGMVSAGHNDPPGPPLKVLSVGDHVYAFLNPRGYVGHGEVTKAVVLAGDFVVDGDFVAKDGSGRFKRVKLTEILLLRRSDMTNDGGDPLVGEWVAGVKWLSTCSRKKPKRFAGMQEPKDTVEELNHPETTTFLASAFRTDAASRPSTPNRRQERRLFPALGAWIKALRISKLKVIQAVTPFI
jgi:hypothetical protein